MNIENDIKSLEKHITNPNLCLPEEIFLFISRNTPLINVDLLIKNKKNQTLLAWRDDDFYQGWHIPGGIIRYKETIEERIKAVAIQELNTTVDFKSEPIMIKEFICKNRNRGHFISMLYECFLTNKLNKSKECDNILEPIKNQWAWHSKCPDNLIEVHRVFEKFI